MYTYIYIYIYIYIERERERKREREGEREREREREITQRKYLLLKYFGYCLLLLILSCNNLSHLNTFTLQVFMIKNLFKIKQYSW